MKRRIINFGDIQLTGAVGEWGLVFTDLAGANEQDILLPFNQKFVRAERFNAIGLGFHFIFSLLYRVSKVRNAGLSYAFLCGLCLCG